MTNTQVKAVITEILANAERYRNCFFWTPPSRASERRNEEFDNEHSFEFEGYSYSVRQSLTISCRNMYFQTIVYKDGVRTNITPLKTILRKLTVAANDAVKQAA